jgi:hypothetical protein
MTFIRVFITRGVTEAENKDLLEPDRLKAVTNLHKYQEETRAWRHLKVKLQEFDVGDLVLLRSPRTESFRKLESKWARPYVVTEKPRSGAYRLLDFQGRMLEHSWNMENLRRFFI